MAMMEAPTVAKVRRLRHRQAIDRLDELRMLRALARTMSQTALARELALSQPSINGALKRAEQVPDIPAGFSGASPYEIAERFAVGDLTREQVIDELSRWPYDPAPTTDGWDTLIVDVPGTHTWEQVGRALDDGLIDDDIYDAVGETRRTNLWPDKS